MLSLHAERIIQLVFFLFWYMNCCFVFDRHVASEVIS
jgi:hypothetical protein